MGKLVGLIGATAPSFFVRELRPIIDRYGYAWYGWTIPVRRKTLLILKEQINDPDVGYFNLYGYSSSWPEGGYAEATHKIEAIFIVKRIDSHWDTGKDKNPCPELGKGIRGKEYGDYYIIDHETGHGKGGRKALPRKTWFAVVDIKEKSIELKDDFFAPWNPKYKIHPSALRANFIDIVDRMLSG